MAQILQRYLARSGCGGLTAAALCLGCPRLRDGSVRGPCGVRVRPGESIGAPDRRHLSDLVGTDVRHREWLLGSVVPGGLSVSAPEGVAERAADGEGSDAGECQFPPIVGLHHDEPTGTRTDVLRVGQSSLLVAMRRVPAEAVAS